jgi:bacterioferritin
MAGQLAPYPHAVFHQEPVMTAPKVLAAVTSLSASKRQRAMSRHDLGRGVRMDGQRADHPALVQLLNKVLATEIVCALRYRRHHFTARSLGADRIAEEFLLHADEELSQADLIAERIMQLGGQPDFAPHTLNERSHLQYVAADSVAEMIRENLAAKRIAIDTYRGLIESAGAEDPSTRRMLDGILALEQSHADELLNLLETEA